MDETYSDSTEECPICTLPLSNLPILTLQCNHTFHLNCLSLSVQSTNSTTYPNYPYFSCPYCRVGHRKKNYKELLQSHATSNANALPIIETQQTIPYKTIGHKIKIIGGKYKGRKGLYFGKLSADPLYVQFLDGSMHQIVKRYISFIDPITGNPISNPPPQNNQLNL